MPGKPKLTDLPKLEEWKAPWEVDDSGKDIPAEEQKIDGTRLKKYLHGLLGDKLKLQTSVDEVTTRAEELETKVAKAPTPEKLTELQQEVARTRQERDDAAAKAGKGSEAELHALKLEVALEKGLTLVQAKRLLGTTKEELTQDAEELLVSFGGKGKPADEGEDEGPARGPRRVFNNSGDPNSGREGDQEEEIDYDKWAADYAAKRRG
jgi:hypothetical protein